MGLPAFAPHPDAPTPDHRQSIVAAHDWLTGWWARRYRERARAAGISPDDLRQQIALGLAEAAARYDPGRGTRFSAFASKFVVRRIAEAFSARPDRREVNCEPDALLLTADELEFRGWVREQRGRHLDELVDRLWDALPNLPEVESRVVWLRFGLDGSPARTLDQIAGTLGVSKGTVANYLALALAKLKKRISV